MGTRSNTLVIETGYPKEVVMVNIYRQMDGYPRWHGLLLADFLSSITLVNGLSLDEKKRVANGVGCLAAQLVAELKDGAGSIYLDNPTKKAGVGVNDYTYIIRANTYESMPIDVQVFSYSKEVFRGGVLAFADFCSKDRT